MRQPLPRVFVTVAITGNLTTPDQTPHLPITPTQIAEACLEAAAAGAAIAHIHVRDPATGRPSMELALYQEVVERIRARNEELILNLTTGPGGRFAPSKDDPAVAGPGTTLMRPEARVEHIATLRPDVCTLDLNTMNSGGQVVINTPENVRRMARVIREAGVSPETVLYARGLLPEGAIFTAIGVGRHVFTAATQSYLLGGHVRVGIEDGVYLSRGSLAPSNAAMVVKIRGIVEALGAEIASAAQARELLGLPQRAAA